MMPRPAWVTDSRWPRQEKAHRRRSGFGREEMTSWVEFVVLVARPWEGVS